MRAIATAAKATAAKVTNNSLWSTLSRKTKLLVLRDKSCSKVHCLSTFAGMLRLLEVNSCFGEGPKLVFGGHWRLQNLVWEASKLVLEAPKFVLGGFKIVFWMLIPKIAPM